MVVNEWIRIVIRFLNMDRVKKSIFRCDWMDAINYSLTSLIKKDTIEAYLVFFSVATIFISCAPMMVTNCVAS
jgi:hypothetical protein